MALGKWIGGVLGFIATGGSPLGILLGVVIGSLFDGGSDILEDLSNQTRSGNQTSSGGTYTRQERYNRQQQQTYQGQRNSFLFSLLVLASYIIKADGKVMHSEMEYVRQFLRMNFGEQAVQQGEQILLKLFEQQKQMGSSQYRILIQQSCQQIAQNMEYSQRLQLLNFLVQIAQADNNVPQAEINALYEVASGLGLSTSEVDSMLNLKKDDLESAYKVLEISPSATDDEVKAAYRKLALKHHPDRVSTLGEDVRKAAEKKFQEINDAKERIYKARGLS